MQGSEVIALVPGRLYALLHSYSLDGRVTTHPIDVSGTTTMNSYVLVEGDSALLVDAGMSVHEQAIERQLADLLPERHNLSILPTRAAEYGPTCAVRTLARRFNLVRMFGTVGDPLGWIDFRPEPEPGANGGPSWIEGIAGCHVGHGKSIAVDPEWRRVVELISPPIRLLPSVWAFDGETGTLFTSDVFTHLTDEVTNGRSVISQPAELPGSDVVHEHLVGSRYWWLSGARPGQIEARLRELFDSYDVRVIAPAFGAISEGAAVVTRQCEQLMDALAMAAAATPAVELIGTP
jgi:hypothetical protein